jgi:hypothetical protein
VELSYRPLLSLAPPEAVQKTENAGRPVTGAQWPRSSGLPCLAWLGGSTSSERAPPRLHGTHKTERAPSAMISLVVCVCLLKLQGACLPV